MSDDKKNDAEVDSSRERTTNETELKPQESCDESEAKSNGSDEPNDIKNEVTPNVEGLAERLSILKDALTLSRKLMRDSFTDSSKLKDSLTLSSKVRDSLTLSSKVRDSLTHSHEADSGISESESPDGSAEHQNIAGLLMQTREKVNAVVGNSSKEKKDLESEGSSSDSDLDDHLEDWSTYRGKFEKCLKGLKVSSEDIQNKPFADLCEMMVRPTTLYRERKRFYFAQRDAKESSEAYIKRLTDLASTCQFGERQDLTIADKFISSAMPKYPTSIRSKKLPWIGLQHEVNCEKALEIAKEDEAEGNEFDQMMGRLTGRGKGDSKKVPPHLAEIIRNEIMEKDLTVVWDDVAGLEFPKSVIQESIVWPLLRPDIFVGLRRSPKAMLLFGPPGTGKTMIAKCIAAQSKSTFFYVSASTLASKWHGEAEQLVRALFTVAAEHQPSVIFFDEVDSLLTQRKTDDHEVSRRVKTEFMIHLDGAATKDETRVLFIGATNRPQDLDEAARRRFVKRLYVPLPDLRARQQLLTNLLKNYRSNLTDNDVEVIASMTNDFSGADIKWLCQDASMEPIRSIPDDVIKEIDLKDIRPLKMYDFVKSLKRIRPSVAKADLTAMVEWDRLYGSSSERPSKDNHFMYS